MDLHEADYRRLIENLGAEYFVYRHDAAGVFTFVSPSISAMLGHSPEDFLVHYGEFLTGNPANADVDRITGLSLKGERQPPYKVEVRHKDGSARLLEISEFPLRDSTGRVIGVEGLARDITERHRKEAEASKLQKLESLGTLAGGLAHDYNNLLTVIMGNISLLQSRLKHDSASLLLLDEAQAASSLAKGLSNQLLTFAKGGSPVAAVMDLRPVLTQAALSALRGSNASCVFDLGESPLPVSVDKDQVSRVIQNLVINAEQAMPDGGEIVLKAAVTDGAEGRRVRLTVEDAGSGIEPAHLPRIFDPYFSTKGVGRGLGLATCHSIMTKHGGSICAESKAGGGALFTLLFPAADAGEVPSPPSSPPPAAPAAVSSGRILVMDDEEPVAKVLARMLEHLGYRADSVGHGEAALEACRRALASDDAYDAVILDLTVRGGLGGLETLAKLAALGSKAKALVSSGYAKDPVLAQFAARGFHGALIKPYRLEEVSEAVRRVLGS